MTLSTTTNRTAYQGSGSAGPFSVPFKFFSASDLEVIKTSASGADTTLTPTTHYTVSGAGDRSGGAVTLLSALASGETLTIRRVTPVTQETSFRNQGTFSGASHEDALDRVVMIGQQQEDAIQRSLKLRASKNPASYNLEIPAPSATNTGKVVTATADGFTLSTLDSSSVALPGAGRTVATLSAYLANNATFNAHDYREDADGADWALAINRAIAAARALYEAGISTGGVVELPSASYYPVATPVVVPAGRAVGLRGKGWTSAVLRATAAMDAVVVLGDSTDQLTWPTIDHLGVDAAGLADYAIYGARVDNALFHRVRCTGALVAGCSIGYGWSNVFHACHWTNNFGDGFQSNNDYSTSNNANSFEVCTALGNNGFGYRLRSGYGVKFDGGTVEQNPKGGIFVTREANALVIDGTYFEGNGATGHTFTSPAVTVKANILLNGDTVETTIGKSFPSKGVSIRGTFCSSAGVEDCHVWASAVTGLELRGNQGTPAAGAAIPLLKMYGDPTYGAVGEIESSGNIGFADPELTITALPAEGQSALRRIRVAREAQQNFAEPDFLRWTTIAANGGGTFQRSASTYRRQPVWEIDGGTGTSHVYGFSLDLSAYPTLQGKTVYFGCWVSQSHSDIGAAVYTNGTLSSSGTSAVTDWRWIEAAVTLGSSGTANFGVFGNNMAVGKTVRFTEPVLGVLGVSAETFYEQPHGRVWWGTAAPTAGTWVLGDRVENRTPSAGQPKGWRCTVAGAPGTWVSEGAL